MFKNDLNLFCFPSSSAGPLNEAKGLSVSYVHKKAGWIVKCFRNNSICRFGLSSVFKVNEKLFFLLFFVFPFSHHEGRQWKENDPIYE
jgi:hypothetical protein